MASNQHAEIIAKARVAFKRDFDFGIEMGYHNTQRPHPIGYLTKNRYIDIRSHELKLSEMALQGVILIEPDIFRDERGFFMETYHQEKYEKAGIREVCPG